MKFRDYFSIKHILFGIGIVALMMVFAFYQSGNMVKVTLDEDSIYVYSKLYNMDIVYSDISKAELTTLEEPGEEVQDAFDDGTLVAGVWKNEAWGEYHCCIDPDTANCVVITLNDGRTMVFSRKDGETTAKLFHELMDHLS
ncbi:MAG: hypothetical protein IJE81_02370 [Oscillospiraceae bacterium]|nr:hypothetical protein [Oscillospiraceae bacterium]MBQ7129623.1 hypothetical protein [Oscillospiraceae bacterium]